MTYYYIGECYEKCKEYVAAIEHYQKAIELDDKVADAWIGIGICNNILGNEVTALKCVKRAIELEETNAEYWFMLADIQEKNNFIDDALNSYQKVCDLDASHPDIWLDYSNYFASNKNYSRAIEIIESGIKIQPENVHLQYRLAAYLLNFGKQKEAYILFEKALMLDFDSHKKLFDYQPELKINAGLLQLIQSFKKNS